jgi:hypothetical protein
MRRRNGPEDDPDWFDEPDGFSDPDNLQDEQNDELIGQTEEETQAEEEKFAKDSKQIRTFLELANVRGAEDASDAEIRLLWERLLKDPSLVEDFIYLLMDRKKKLYLCDYPLAVEMDEAIGYAMDFENPQSLRRFFIENVVPNVVQYGVGERRAYELAQTEIQGEKVAASVRFLGWLLGQDFTLGVYPKLVEESKKRQLEVTDLGTYVTSEVMEHLEVHEARVKTYHFEQEMDKKAHEAVYEDAVIALRGILKRCKRDFLGWT